MTRPHVEFIQSQALSWTPSTWTGWYEGTQLKILSEDANTGAISALIKYPAGWSITEQFFIDADEELFVLTGKVRVGSERYDEYSYAHLPSGFLRTGAHCEAESIILTFLSKAPRSELADISSCDMSRLIRKIDALSAPLSTDFAKLGVRNAPDAALRVQTASFLLLREDPYTREQTWILAARGLRHGNREEIHPVVEEMYLLGGDLIGPNGTMLPGAYFWRPAGIKHGPFGSKAGSLIFHRAIGGPLSTTYVEGADHFQWDPEYRPVLPPYLARYRTSSIPNTSAY